MSGLDLYLKQAVLVRMLLVALVTGAAVGLLFDLSALLRIFCLGSHTSPLSRRKKIALVGFRLIADLIITLIASVTFLLVCYYTSDGQVRSPAVMGGIVGFLLYRYTIGRLVCRLGNTFVLWLRNILRVITGGVICLLSWVGIRLIWPYFLRPLWLMLAWMWKQTVGRVVYRIRKRATERALQAMIANAGQGFGLGAEIDTQESAGTQ